MEVNRDSKKLMELVQSTPEMAPVPSPSRKRKGDGLFGDGATLEELRADEAALRAELSNWKEKGVRAVAEIRRRQKEGFDLNSSEGKQFFQSMIDPIKNNVDSVLDSLELNYEEQKVNMAQFVESNRRTTFGLSDSMAKPNPKYQMMMMVQGPKKVDMSSKGFPMHGRSESCYFADDNDDEVGAMEFDTSAMEEQASGKVSGGGTLAMETEMQAPVVTDDVDDEEELVGLGMPMFQSPADYTPTTKFAAELDEMDRDKSSEQLADEATKMAAEERNFTEYASNWEFEWGSKSNGCGSFADMTTLSSLQLAHWIPGPPDPGRVGMTLQVYSIKLSELKGGLQWPLRVYGVVAVRDTVDHNRNLLFARNSTTCQIVEADDPYLCLIGPSRAVLLEDSVVFEIQLKLGVSPMSRDRSLISGTRKYSVGYDTISFENCFCTTELRVQAIEYSVQATILGIRVKDGPWPSFYGGIIYCFAPPLAQTEQDRLGRTEQEDQKLVLLDSRCRRMPGLEGRLRLSRNVVSAQVGSYLKFTLKTYSSLSGDLGASETVSFDTQLSDVTRKSCLLGESEVEITVAWSRLVGDKKDIALKGWVEMDEYLSD